MSCRGFFITGTDTGVGKTWFTARLARALRRRGLNAGVWKPVQSGHEPGSPASDSAVLKRISGVDDPEDVICPITLRASLAPMVAARIEGLSLSIEEMLQKGALLFRKYDIVLVEGAGGLAVPISLGELIVNMAARLGLPLLIVARPDLGTINHTLLSVAYAGQHGLPVRGVILNGYQRPITALESLTDLDKNTVLNNSLSSNPACIEHYAQVPVRGRIPYLTNDDDRFEDVVQVEKLIQDLEETR